MIYMYIYIFFSLEKIYSIWHIRKIVYAMIKKIVFVNYNIIVFIWRLFVKSVLMNWLMQWIVLLNSTWNIIFTLPLYRGINAHLITTSLWHLYSRLLNTLDNNGRCDYVEGIKKLEMEQEEGRGI